MPRRRNLEDQPPVNPDPLDANVGGAGAWGLPSTEGIDGQLAGQSPTMLRRPQPPTGDNYADGIFVGAPDDAVADPAWPPAHLIGAATDAPRAYEAPHEATHRRYEPVLSVPINQAAAGFTLIAPTRIGLHYVKLIACVLTLDAAGTLRFVQGSNDGTNVAPMSGDMAFGASQGFVLPPAELQNPWAFTAPDQGFGLFTVTGKAQGFVLVCYSPYDQ